MSTYATLAELKAYTDLDTGVSDPTLQTALDRAERDVDSIVTPLVAGSREATGLKLDPASLLDWQAAALSRATCAQAEYRLAMGEDFFIRAQHSTVRGPDFSLSGQLPYIGPKVFRELTETGFVRADGVSNVRIGSATAPAWRSSELLP